MDTFNIHCSRQHGIEFYHAFDVQDSFFEDLILSIEQTLLPFRMGLAYGPVEGREQNERGFSLGFHATPSR